MWAGLLPTMTPWLHQSMRLSQSFLGGLQSKLASDVLLRIHPGRRR